MPGSVLDLFFGWYHWLGKHNSDIWNLVLGCLMWTICTEQDWHSFKDTGKSLAQLLDLCHWTLYDCSWFWGLSDFYTLRDFLLSIRIVLCQVCLFFISVPLCSLLWTLCIFHAFPFSIIFFLTYQKKKKKAKNKKQWELCALLPRNEGVSDFC